MNLVQPEAPPLSGRRILVADDSPAACLILKGILEGAGATVTAVPDGEDVVDLVQSAARPYDALVLDVVMERVGGFQAARRIRVLPETPKHVVIFVSARIDEEARRCAHDVEAFHELLPKPIVRDEVVRVVCAALGVAVAPGIAPSEPAAVDLRIAGCDIVGALDRCGGDRVMLLGLHRQLQDDTGRRLSIARQALRGRLYRIARNELHRTRGDLLNLGFLDITSRLAEIENDVISFAVVERETPDTTLPRGFLDAGERLADGLLDVERELGEAVARVRQLPAMATASLAQPAGASHGLQAAAFSQLVSALEADELAAMRMADLRNRVLPERYPDPADRDFRLRMARLDFRGALQLLDSADRAQPVAVNSSGYRILLVDDMSSTVLLLFGILEPIGRVRFALTGERALKIAKSWTPDLVIADVHLGAMSGIEFCRYLKASAQCADSAVMLMSADGDIATEVEGLTAGASDFLSKPLNPARVVGRVNAQLAGLRRVTAAAAAIAGESSSAALGFVTSTHAGVVIDVSPCIGNELSRGGASLRGRALRELFDPGAAAAIDRALRDIATHGRAAPFEAALQGGEGAWIPVRIVGWSAPGVSARIAWLSIEDRRDRLSSGRQRFEEELSRSVGMMAGGIAHEFNNLLNIAIGNLDIALEGTEVDARQRERLSRASDALMRAAQISRQLGDFGLRGENTEGFQTLDQLIDQIWRFVANNVPAGVVVLRERAAEDVQLRVEARGLRSALTNLLQNAYDAMPEGGQVVVRSGVRRKPGADGPLAMLEISDTGTGMSEETRMRACEPFFTTRRPGHTGLGLTQVRGFVQRNGGSLDIESTPGTGTTARIRFES